MCRDWLPLEAKRGVDGHQARGAATVDKLRALLEEAHVRKVRVLYIAFGCCCYNPVLPRGDRQLIYQPVVPKTVVTFVCPHAYKYCRALGPLYYCGFYDVCVCVCVCVLLKAHLHAGVDVASHYGLQSVIDRLRKEYCSYQFVLLRTYSK